MQKPNGGKSLAVAACVACCALNVGILVLGAGSMGAVFAALLDARLAFTSIGLMLIAAAAYSIWKRGRASAICCAAPPTPSIK
jgi:hypothetical protein